MDGAACGVPPVFLDAVVEALIHPSTTGTPQRPAPPRATRPLGSARTGALSGGPSIGRSTVAPGETCATPHRSKKRI
jgi:hypothetical protein